MKLVDECDPEELVNLSGPDEIDLRGIARYVHVPIATRCDRIKCGWKIHTTILMTVTTTRDRAGLSTETVNFLELSQAILELREFLEERHRNATFGRCNGFVEIYTEHEPLTTRLQATA